MHLGQPVKTDSQRKDSNDSVLSTESESYFTTVYFYSQCRFDSNELVLLLLVARVLLCCSRQLLEC